MWGDDEGPSDATVDASTSGQDVLFKPHKPKQRVRQKKATEAGPRKPHLLAVHAIPLCLVRETPALFAVPPMASTVTILPWLDACSDATDACVFA